MCMRMAVSLVHAHVVNGGLGRLEWQQLCRCHQRMSTEYVGCVYDVWDIPDVVGVLFAVPGPAGQGLDEAWCWGNCRSPERYVVCVSGGT